MSGHRSAVNAGYARTIADVSPDVARMGPNGNPAQHGIPMSDEAREKLETFKAQMAARDSIATTARTLGDLLTNEAMTVNEKLAKPEQRGIYDGTISAVLEAKSWQDTGYWLPD